MTANTTLADHTTSDLESEDFDTSSEEFYSPEKDKNTEERFIVSKSYGDSGEDETIRLYLMEISKYPIPNAAEEKELSAKIKAGDESALDSLINRNLRLVVKISKQYSSPDYPLVDVIQDGNIGLMRAANKFDGTRNVRFSTYASWWIKQTIIRSLSIKKRMIRLPHRKEEKLRQLNRAYYRFYQENSFYPNYDELAGELGLTRKDVSNIINNNPNVMSFDVSIGEDDKGSVKDLLFDDNYRPDFALNHSELCKEAVAMLEGLSEKENAVIKYRFGFDEGKKVTLKSMGEMFGISAETVRQIEIKVLKRLRVRYGHLREFLKEAN